MHALLSRLLEKRKISDIQKLNVEEKAVYERWQGILVEGELTIAKVEDFCRNQLGLIEAQWLNLDNSVQKNERLIVMHTVYRTIHNLLTKPRPEREALEKHLHQLLQENI